MEVMNDLKQGDKVVCFHNAPILRNGIVKEVYSETVRVIFTTPPYFEVINKALVHCPKTIYEETLHGTH